MRNKQFFLFLVLTMLMNACAAQKSSTVDFFEKATKLKQLYVKATSSVRNSYRLEFFSEFPNSFSELNKLYGYTNDKAGPLYEFSNKHIYELFNNLKDIPDTLYYNKIIRIAIGGHWDADGIDAFQDGLRTHVLNNLDLTLEILEKYSDRNIESFWFFYFDGPHPSSQIDDRLQTLKDKDSKIYKLMISAHKKVMKQLH